MRQVKPEGTVPELNLFWDNEEGTVLEIEEGAARGLDVLRESDAEGGGGALAATLRGWSPRVLSHFTRALPWTRSLFQLSRDGGGDLVRMYSRKLLSPEQKIINAVRPRHPCSPDQLSGFTRLACRVMPHFCSACLLNPVFLSPVQAKARAKFANSKKGRDAKISDLEPPHSHGLTLPDKVSAQSCNTA